MWLHATLNLGAAFATQHLYRFKRIVSDRQVLARRGPSAFARSAAAYQLLAFTARLRHPHLTAAAPHLYPPLLAAFADPAPFAQACAARALSHLATHATAASLYWHRDILTHAVRRVMTGCDATVFPAALPCSAALAARLDSVDGGVAHSVAALRAATGEVSRSGHDAGVRRAFLQCLAAAQAEGSGPQGILRRVGLKAVGLFRTLLPLLIEWTAEAGPGDLQLVARVRSTQV